MTNKEKMATNRFLKSIGWTNGTLDTYVDSLGMAYRKGFIDALNDFGDKDIKRKMLREEMKEIVFDAVKKMKEDFCKEIGKGK